MNTRPRSMSALIMSVAMIVAGLAVSRPAEAGPNAGPALSAAALSGRFILLHADAADSELTVPAVVVGAKVYRLHGKASYAFKPGQPVNVSGRVSGQDMTVTTMAAGSSPAAKPGSPAGTPTSLHVLVEMVSWTAPNSTTTAQAQQQYAVTNNTWFTNDSYGALSVTATATRWLSIATPGDPDGSGGNTACDNIATIQREGDAAATTAGYNPSAYTNIVYYYPTCAGEQWGGWGEVGGNRTWLIGEMDTRVAVHELGHNLGLNHSRSDTCTSAGATVAYSISCVVSEYGDPVSAMGGGFAGQGMYVANQQAALGWLGTSAHLITTVRSSGTFVLAPYESMAGGVQALKVTNTAGKEFWVEYRQPTGNDSFMTAANIRGVLIHSADGTYSHLYDMIPVTANNFTDAALPAGSRWTDPTSSLSITLSSASASGASVSISLGSGSYILTVSKAGTGTGTVTSSPTGISCGGTCFASFSGGTHVTLSQTPASGSTFAGWSGACTGTASTCVVLIGSAAAVQATFTSSSTVLVEETSSSIAYSGRWALGACTTPGCSPDRLQRRTTSGSSKATLQYTGRSADLIGTRGPGGGKARIYEDGVYKTTINLDNVTTIAGVTLYAGAVRTLGAHTLTVKRVSGRLNIDAFRRHS